MVANAPQDPSDHDPIHLIKTLLHGGTIALVGGLPRQPHITRLANAFDLKDVLWVSMRESDPSPRRFSSVVVKPELVLVVALNGLLRHQHARDLRALCRHFEVPLLVYWRSPHPAGLADAIISQRLIKRIRDRRGG